MYTIQGYSNDISNKIEYKIKSKKINGQKLKWAEYKELLSEGHFITLIWVLTSSYFFKVYFIYKIHAFIKCIITFMTLVINLFSPFQIQETNKTDTNIYIDEL